MKIERVPIDALIPYARNAKKHRAEQIAAIAASIKEFGFNNPVLIAADNSIIAGHGRVMAAQKLGLKEVPCIRIEHLTDAQRRAYILADNRLGEIGGGWDVEMLNLEIEELGDALDGFGFSPEDLKSMGVELEEAEKTKDDEIAIVSICEVIAECKDENEQAEIYKLLTDKGVKCRVATL